MALNAGCTFELPWEALNFKFRGKNCQGPILHQLNQNPSEWRPGMGI